MVMVMAMASVISLLGTVAITAAGMVVAITVAGMVVAITAVITAAGMAGMAAITVTTDDQEPAEKSRPALSPLSIGSGKQIVALLR